MIQFHEESKTFHLYNDQISYIFKILNIISQNFGVYNTNNLCYTFVNTICTF